MQSAIALDLILLSTQVLKVIKPKKNFTYKKSFTHSSIPKPKRDIHGQELVAKQRIKNRCADTEMCRNKPSASLYQLILICPSESSCPDQM